MPALKALDQVGIDHTDHLSDVRNLLQVIHKPDTHSHGLAVRFGYRLVASNPHVTVSGSSLLWLGSPSARKVSNLGQIDHHLDHLFLQQPL